MTTASMLRSCSDFDTNIALQEKYDALSRGEAKVEVGECKYMVEYKYRAYGSRRWSLYCDTYIASSARNAVAMLPYEGEARVLSVCKVIDGCGKPVAKEEWA